MPHEIDVAVPPLQLEVPVVGVEPLVQHFGDLDASLAEQQRAGRFLATMSRIAFHADFERQISHHLLF
ncbi:MAG: hypothetical protein A3H96_05800 [Acidobacteria bacterium RIFCSPLOWO2_02_FULL_67_36]|nr:MAG: hypothetical protein A3H96_05800 [Acidobacteria bacterium RIFCSPLOWO2_02_FULL_67_36]OFW19766.1 MAG: hypothetical protein A3G21_13380 [Acidobacteria bacterium RIFCSPLOWO2_12_FULL_66_21]